MRELALQHAVRLPLEHPAGLGHRLPADAELRVDHVAAAALPSGCRGGVWGASVLTGEGLGLRLGGLGGLGLGASLPAPTSTATFPLFYFLDSIKLN